MFELPTLPISFYLSAYRTYRAVLAILVHCGVHERTHASIRTNHLRVVSGLSLECGVSFLVRS
jgi:hypothetical protein